MRGLTLAAVLLWSGLAVGQAREEVGLPAAVETGQHALSKAAHTAVDFSMVPRLAGSPTWKINVAADGTGTYQEDVGAPLPLRVSQGFWEKVQAGASAVEGQGCETRQKNIAQTGKKTLTYTQGQAVTTCSFNYSDDASVNGVAEAFQGLAATMQFGARLRHDRRFDHLGLAAEMDALVKAVKDGRALEVRNIAPVLQGLVEDEEVIGVVRRHAKELLDGAGAGDAAPVL